jgi:formate-dependent phosphoribosylglycinamide formyltransferase (GAR transformylase)
LIKNEVELKSLVDRFPQREVRVTKFVEGPVFTLNAVVSRDTDETFLGNTSYQITGISPFTDLEFSTIGNDWALPKKILPEKQQHAVQNMARLIGRRLKKSGWKGLFGIDTIYDVANDKMHLIEINSRQPASSVFESNLQRRVGNDMTIFEAHLCALLELPLKGVRIQQITDGSQIVQRVTNTGTRSVQRDSIHKLREKGYYVAEYENAELNKELIRIQTGKNIMEKHGGLSHTGKEIRDIIHGQ